MTPIAMFARRAGLLCAAAAILVAPAPAAAQLAPGYSGYSGIRYMGDEEVWWTIRQLGDCLARGRRRAALALVGTRPGSPEEAVATRAVLGTNTTCMRQSGRMTLGRDIIRGVIAEGLYRSSGAAPPPPQAFDETAVPEGLPLLVDFARCFAQVRPAEIHNLVATTRLGTREEQQALIALAPHMGQCFPAGATFSFPAPAIRLAFIEALYHRASAAAPRQQRGR